MNKLLALLCFLSLLPSAKAGSLFRDAPAYPANSFPYSLALGDFNEDRKLDVVVAGWLGYSTGLSVILGNGDGSFQSAVSYQVGSEPYSVTLGDFNQDGAPDFAVSNYVGNNVVVFVGLGDGSFHLSQDVNTGNGPVSLAAGDFNGDSKLDLVVT